MDAMEFNYGMGNGPAPLSPAQERAGWGTHIGHCCVLHGCKYGRKSCPVVRRKARQEGMCESCEYDGLKSIPDPTDANYDLLLMNEVELRAEAVRLRKLVEGSR